MLHVGQTNDRGNRLALRLGWAIFAGLLGISLALRFMIVPWSPPFRLTFSQSPITDESWQAMTAQNQVRNPGYVPKPLTQRMDRVRALWPLIHTSNYLTTRALGYGVIPRRRVAFAVFSLLLAAMAWVVSRGKDPVRACLVLLFAGASFPLAYFYRVGLGYELVMLQLFLVVLLLGDGQVRLWRLILAGLLCGVAVATYLNALPFGAACAIWLLLPEKRRQGWPGQQTWLRWLAFGSAALLTVGLVFWFWTYPKGGFDPELFRGRTPGGWKQLVRSLSNLRLFPMRLHEPFLLALFAYLGLTELGRNGLVRSRRSLLILWATVWLCYIAVLPYQPLRYLQFSLVPMALLTADTLTEPAGENASRVRGWLTTLVACVPLLVACLPKLNIGPESMFAAWGMGYNLELVSWMWWSLPLGLLVARLLGTFWQRLGPHRAGLAFLCLGFVVCNTTQFVAWQRHHTTALLATESQLAKLLDGPQPTLVDIAAMPYVQATTSPIYVFDERYVNQYAALGIRHYVTTVAGDWRFRRYLKQLGLGPNNAIGYVPMPASRATLQVIRARSL